MTERAVIEGSGDSPDASVRARLADFLSWLAGLDATDLSDRERIDALAALQSVAAAVGGAQAELTAAYADSQRALGCTSRGIATEVGIARRVGLSRAMDLAQRSRVLVQDLPEVASLMRTGDLDEHRGLLVADRVSALDPALRRLVDDRLGDDVCGLSDAELRGAVDRVVAGLDPDSVDRRRADALNRRHVSVRPAPDGMADLTIRCDAVHAAAAVTTLARHADAVLAGVGGLAAIPEQAEGRSRDAIMADAATSWLTGHHGYEGPAVEVQLVLSAGSLVGGPDCLSFDPTPAHVVGVGPIPASAARALIGRGADRRHDPTDLGTRAGEARARGRRADREARRVTIRRVWASDDGTRLLALERRRRIVPPALRAAFATDERAHPFDPRLARLRAELFRAPDADQLVPLSSEDRCYTGGLRRFVELRDQTCRVPFCGAPIRHIDHVTPYCHLPRTTADGGIGTCVGHNLAKEDPGHTVTVLADGFGEMAHTIGWRTPTGRCLSSTAPPVLGWGASLGEADLPDPDGASPLEAALGVLLAA